eukprot:TRINITY_DN2979_c0_g1_i1.p1 TRINITY_DN2979_c0_g1~~TRINITY_DN2979_c0_g1_i1.p1  ORF type:complete len:257 (+),score=17.45 TRINITY_DN2979_c0_g1_i1:123-893(+)
MKRHTHVIAAQTVGSGDLNRWYDQPDIRDLFLGGVLDEVAPGAVCLDAYRAGVGGFRNFQLNSDKSCFTAQYLNAADKPLADKVVAYSVLTIGTTEPSKVAEKFDRVLNGIDGVCGDDGLPRLILVPVLMHMNHFGIVAIQMAKGRPEVFLFNSMGVLLGFYDEEKLIFSYLQRRYGVSQINHNGNHVYQRDGCSCGPFIIEFARASAQTVTLRKHLLASFNERHKDIWTKFQERRLFPMVFHFVMLVLKLHVAKQ